VTTTRNRKHLNVGISGKKESEKKTEKGSPDPIIPTVDVLSMKTAANYWHHFWGIGGRSGPVLFPLNYRERKKNILAGTSSIPDPGKKKVVIKEKGGECNEFPTE